MAVHTNAALPRQVKNIKGQTFGRLTALRFAGINKNRAATWICQCSCEDKTQLVLSGNALRTGHTQSCGCLYDETRETSARTHGGCYDIEYDCWKGMMHRCYDPNHRSYPTYGARGITVQQSWHDYQNFKKDVPPRPEKALTLDRFPDKNGNYEINNVRWATRKEQQRNMRSNVNLTYKGETRTIAGWNEVLGWKRSKLGLRLRAGWSVERALGTP